MWRVDSFTVARLPAEADARAGLTLLELRSSDAYLVLAFIADGGGEGGRSPERRKNDEPEAQFGLYGFSKAI